MVFNNSTSEKLKMEVELEEALNIAGAGKYQIFHCALMLATLTFSLLEMICYAFVLPAAACELDLPDNLRGLITSIPNIGIILTAPFWGQAADSFGRKPTLLLSCAATGLIGFIAAFMPNLVSFGICKLIGALFLSCPTSLGYAYAGEMVPQRRRDLAVLIINGILTVSSVLSPFLAWVVLSHEWQLQISGFSLRPWRILTIVYSLPLLLTALWMTQSVESPKFLMAKGKPQEALKVLKHIYAKNTGVPADKYPVASLKKSVKGSVKEADSEFGSKEEPALKKKSLSALALLKPPHLKWFALTSFLMFGLYSLLNGLYLFSADTMNKVLRISSDEEGSLCLIMNQSDNQTVTEPCIDTISQDTFLIMVTTSLSVGILVLLASISPLSKKTLLVGMYVTAGAACLLSGLLTNRVVAGVAMSSLQLTALGIGPISAYAVQLFPTSLRGTAVGAVLMFGRVGSVFGANLSGYLLVSACIAAFYVFAVLVIVCAALSFLLPKDQESSSDE